MPILPKVSKWAEFKGWLKKHLPQFLQQGIISAIEFLIPWALKFGLAAMVPAPRKAAYEAKVAAKTDSGK